MIRLRSFIVLACLAWALPAEASKVTPITSPGGLKAWHVHEPSIPIVTINVAFRGGAATEPIGKEGLAKMLASLMDEGAGDMDSQAFQRRLQELAVALRFDSGRDSFSLSIRTLTKFRDEAVALADLALTKPRFDAEAIERIRAQVAQNIRRRSQSPDAILSQTFFKQGFPGHPYGRSSEGSEESIKAISAEDLRSFLLGRFAKDNMVIGVVGDVDAAEAGRLLDRAFGGLPAKSLPIDVPETRLAAGGDTLIVRRPVPQSVVMWGLPGIKRNDPDFFPVTLLNHVLGGGGFNSRLYEEVREKRGLAYSVYSSLVPMDRTGILLGGLGTQNERVAESIEVLRSQLRDIAEHGIRPEELTAAKTYTAGSFALRLDSNGAIAATLVSLQMNDLGIDYLDRRVELINAVTLADVQRVARQLIRPEAMFIVTVGDPQGLQATRAVE
ncbi:MAG: insulinase family protein [Alphaproteobacteria bacterium]|nr:insulinase family protein [Alphaproteobacteria bacterium]